MNIFLRLKLNATDEDTNLDFHVNSARSFDVDPNDLSVEDKEWLDNLILKTKEKLDRKISKKFNKD